MTGSPLPQSDPSAAPTRRFLWRVAITWFVYPLLLGVIGLFWGLYRPPFAPKIAHLDPDLAAAIVLSLGGVVLGAFAATIHSVVAYFQCFGKQGRTSGREN